MKAKYVQGDVFLVPTELPKNLKRVDATERGLILAKGESTGHAHTIDSPDALLFEAPNKELFLHATKEVSLKHEEHNAITIAPGVYRVGIVQEYDYFLEEARKVVD